MRFKLKRFVSLAIGAVMMLGTVPPVSAASAGAVYVSHFEDFSGWTSEQGSNNDLPEGFCGFDGEYHPDRAEATGSYVDEEVGTRAFKLKNGAMIAYGFDKVYKTGVRRISFDAKLSAKLDQGKNFFLYGINNTAKDDDVNNWKNGKDFDSRLYGCIRIGNFAAYNTSWSLIGTTANEPFYDFKWHKIELVFDYDNNKITYFADGTYVAEDGNWSANKAFYFTNETEKDVYIDNFAVFHGDSAEYAAENHMKVDGYSGSVIQTDGGTLNLDFSRALTDESGNALTSVDKGDFKIKDSSGRDVSDLITEARLSDGRKSTVKLTLGALASGVYTLEYKNAANYVTFRTPPRYVDGVMCPDVEKVSYISHDGKEQNKKSEISTGTAAINIQFTTGIDDSNPSENIMLTHNGIETACTFTVSSDKKTISLTPESGFEPETEYTLSVSGNIAASESANAKMGLDYTEKFKTLNDAMYVISTEDIEKDGENAYFKVKVIKTNDKPEHKYTYAVAGYKSVVNPENGKTYMQMTALNRFPVIISETDKGIISFGNNQPLDISNADKVSGFLWEYPNNTPIVIKEFENK